MNPFTQARITEINWLLAEGLYPAQIAKHMNISRQRVHQILGNLGKLKPNKLKSCSRCGIEFVPITRNRIVCTSCRHNMVTTFVCAFCSKVTPIPTAEYRIRLKHKRTTGTELFCSKSCNANWQWRNKRQVNNTEEDIHDPTT